MHDLKAMKNVKSTSQPQKLDFLELTVVESSSDEKVNNISNLKEWALKARLQLTLVPAI